VNVYTPPPPPCSHEVKGTMTPTPPTTTPTARKCQDFALAHQVPRFLWLQRWSQCGSVGPLASPGLQVYPEPKSSFGWELSAPLGIDLGHYSARPLDGTMFHASCMATGPSHPDNKTTTPLLPLLLGTVFSTNRRLLCDRRL
jgi:hypothetical protein